MVSYLFPHAFTSQRVGDDLEVSLFDRLTPEIRLGLNLLLNTNLIACKSDYLVYVANLENEVSWR